MKTTEQKIKETEEKLKNLKVKKSQEDYKSTWVKIPELGIEIQNKIHHKNKSYNDLIEEFGEDFLEKSLPTYHQLQVLRNLENAGDYKLGLIDAWEFVKQEDDISKKNSYVARFYSGSDFCYLDCFRYSSSFYSGLGVRFVRPLKVKK